MIEWKKEEERMDEWMTVRMKRKKNDIEKGRGE